MIGNRQWKSPFSLDGYLSWMSRISFVPHLLVRISSHLLDVSTSVNISPSIASEYPEMRGRLSLFPLFHNKTLEADVVHG